MTTITAHGFRFNVDSDGFVKNHAEGDRDIGIAAMETRLAEMDARTVSAMHSADRAWQERDCEGDRPPLIDEVESVGHRAATAGWAKPDAASFSVSAAK